MRITLADDEHAPILQVQEQHGPEGIAGAVIVQPEVGAEAVYWAPHQRHRAVFVGWTTPRAIRGRRVIPGILDHLPVPVHIRARTGG